MIRCGALIDIDGDTYVCYLHPGDDHTEHLGHKVADNDQHTARVRWPWRDSRGAA